MGMKKIYWIDTANRFELAGRVQITSYDRENTFSVGLSERDMDPIQQWCEEHNCGKRRSFDTFRFRNKKEITMFLLRWG
jgi:hypothetical protein